jgi:hypothetical protein
VEATVRARLGEKDAQVVLDNMYCTGMARGWIKTTKRLWIGITRPPTRDMQRVNATLESCIGMAKACPRTMAKHSFKDVIHVRAAENILPFLKGRDFKK